MSAVIVIKQMMIMFFMIMTGFFLYKKKIISPSASKDMSALVVNVCSPAMIIGSVLGQGASVPKESVGIVAAAAVICYIFLTILGYVLVLALRIPGSKKDAYVLMTIFGNLGYIGIPVAMAVIGPKSMIYVAVFNFISNVYMFTFGITLIRREDKEKKSSWTDIFTPGFISCIVAIAIYWFQIKVPTEITSLLHYFGDACTMLSLLVIGTSLVGMNFFQVLRDKRLFLFILVRFLLVPAVLAQLLHGRMPDEIMRATIVLMMALPVANLPMMLFREYGRDTRTLSEGIIMTTVLSAVTISIAFLFV